MAIEIVRQALGTGVTEGYSRYLSGSSVSERGDLGKEQFLGELLLLIIYS